jgi:spore maturation protein CgeB
MLSAIDLIYPPQDFDPAKREQQIENTLAFSQALEKEGVATRLLDPQKENIANFLNPLMEEPPSATLVFNGLLPDKEGHFLAELIHVPHIAYILDHPLSFIPLTKCPLNYLALPDRHYSAFFKMTGFTKGFFFPPAVIEKTYSPLEKEYTCVLFDASIDYEKIEQEWLKKYPQPLIKIMEDVVAKALLEPKRSYIAYFIEMINEHGSINPREVPILEVLDSIEKYIEKRELVAQLRSLGDLKIDIFSSASKESFQHYLKGFCSDVTFHEPLREKEKQNLLRSAKILITNRACYRDGMHIDVLRALQCGALAYTSSSSYMESFFKESQGVFYASDTGACDKIKTLLDNPSLYAQAIQEGQKTLLENHTYSQRASQLKVAMHTLFNL